MDFNGDGYKDLIVGERGSTNGGDAYVYFFARNSDKTLKTKIILQANGTNIAVTHNSSPEVVDWNEDGLLDLLVGSDPSADGVRLYLNSGTKTQYKYTTFTKLKTGSTDIAYDREQIQVVDLNYDGKKDFLIGNGLTTKETRIYYYENSGTNTAPVLKTPVALMTKDNKPVYPNLIGYDITFDVADWNGDGGWDIIMGDYDGNKIYLFLGDPHAVEISSKVNKSPGLKTFSWDIKRKIFTARFDLIKTQCVEFNVVTSDGRFIQKHSTDELEAGDHAIDFSINDIAQGVYFVSYRVNATHITNKIFISR